MKSCEELFLVMKQDEEKFLEEMGALPDALNRDYYLYASVRCYADWMEKYNEEFAADNIRDVYIWMCDNMKKTGRMAIKNHAWVRKSLVGDVVRLGRLQFEKIPDSERGTVLNVHIPEGGPLRYEDVCSAFSRAEKFFGISDFVCLSWLLSPELLRYLPEDSNIRRFQEMFTIDYVSAL